MIKDDVDNYVKTLDNTLQRLLLQVESLITSIGDTLSDDFQIVCEIYDVFHKYAKRAKE